MLWGPAIEEEVRYRQSEAQHLAAEAALAREIRKIGASRARSAKGHPVLAHGAQAAAGAWRIVKAVMRAAMAKASFVRTTA